MSATRPRWRRRSGGSAVTRSVGEGRLSGIVASLGISAGLCVHIGAAALGVIMLVVLPALVLVFAAGFVIGGVRAPVGAWLASLALMWLALIPMTILGVVVGLWVKGDAVQGLTTLLLLVLSCSIATT